MPSLMKFGYGKYIRVALSAEGINCFSRTTFAMATESGGFGDIPVLHG